MARTALDHNAGADGAGTCAGGATATARPVVRAPLDPARRVCVDLPERLAPLAGEAELLHHHLKDWLSELFAGEA